jgi:hypothetical protein
MTDKTRLKQYLEISEQLIEIADKEQLAECARLLAMNVAHYEMQYGALSLEDTLATASNGIANDQQIELTEKGLETMVGVLGSVMQGLDEKIRH